MPAWNTYPKRSAMPVVLLGCRKKSEQQRGQPKVECERVPVVMSDQVDIAAVDGAVTPHCCDLLAKLPVLMTDELAVWYVVIMT